MALPEPTSAPHYLYSLRVDILATDAAVLLDAIEGEPFGLAKRLGAEEINRQIRELQIDIEATSPSRWDDFENDISILSVYLPQDITGFELHVEPTAGAPKLEGWKIVGRRGETARLKLYLAWDASDSSIINNDVDIEDAARRWNTLPEWTQVALRAKHPQLRAA
jgi:hypothetical protein